jgi:hypothetical protein
MDNIIGYLYDDTGRLIAVNQWFSTATGGYSKWIFLPRGGYGG